MTSPFMLAQTALRKALISQCHPKMLLAIALPFLVSLIASIILLIWVWGPLDNWLLQMASDWTWFKSILAYRGVTSLSEIIVGIIAFIAIALLALVIGLVTASIFVTPMAVGFLSQTAYPSLEKKGENENTTSLVNVVKVISLFILGWLLTLPLWLIPFMSIALSLFWGAFVFSQLNKVDAIVAHANAKERKIILQENKKAFWIIGLICALLSLIPFMGLVMPVFSILAMTHLGLARLQNLREKNQSSLDSLNPDHNGPPTSI